MKLLVRLANWLWRTVLSRGSAMDRDEAEPNARLLPASFPDIEYRRSEKTPALAEIRDGEMVEVVFNGSPLWIMFKCPCRSGHVISLPAAKDRNPHWSTTLRDGRVSLSPSVYQRENCYSHFWITDGGVSWCGNSGVPPWIAEPLIYQPPSSGRRN